MIPRWTWQQALDLALAAVARDGRRRRVTQDVTGLWWVLPATVPPSWTSLTGGDR